MWIEKAHAAVPGGAMQVNPAPRPSGVRRRERIWAERISINSGYNMPTSADA
jgi:hypothetical protein